MNEKYKAYSLGNNYGTEYPITTVNTWIIDKASIVPINTATLISQNKKSIYLLCFIDINVVTIKLLSPTSVTIIITQLEK